MAKSNTDYFGFLAIDKPSGITSHDVVARVRRRLNVKQVGHAGTLDPMATGVMVVAVGKACRLLRFLKSDKTYQAKVLLGRTTDTDDVQGKSITEAAIEPADFPDRDKIDKALDSFRGQIDQLPPLYSAIHVEGKRLYEMARSGEAQKDSVAKLVQARPVTIYSLSLDAIASPCIDLTVHCSGGTYIRSIARDLGQALGPGACLAALKRTKSGDVNLGDCLPLQDFMESEAIEGKFEEVLLSAQDLMPMPKIEVGAEIIKKILRGQIFEIPASEHAKLPDAEHIEDDSYVYVNESGTDKCVCIGVRKKTTPALIKPEVVLVSNQ